MFGENILCCTNNLLHFSSVLACVVIKVEGNLERRLRKRKWKQYKAKRNLIIKKISRKFKILLLEKLSLAVGRNKCAHHNL